MLLELPPPSAPDPSDAPMTAVSVVSMPVLDVSRRIHTTAPIGWTVERIVAHALPGIGLTAPVEVYIDGVRILRPVWRRVKPKAGTTVVVRLIPQGGGAGGTRGILQILVAIAAIAAQIILGPILGPLGTFLVTTAILIGGNLLINALVPLPKQDQGQTKPNYTIGGFRNQLTPDQPVPKILGRHRIAPPYVVPPFTTTEGDDRYVTAAFLLGYGPLTISDIRLGDTPLSKFKEVQYEVREGIATDAALSLTPTQVIEEQLSVELSKADADLHGPPTRYTASNATEASIDLLFPGGLWARTRSGRPVSATVQVRVRMRKVGVTAWTTVGTLTYTMYKQQGFFRTFRWDLPERGRYEIELSRLTADTDDIVDAQAVTTVQWVALRSFRPEYPIQWDQPVALLAVKVKATKQLNGTLDTLNCIVESRIPDWDADTGTWIERETSNPASHYRYALQGPENLYPFDDDELDLDALTAWHEFCDDRGLTYNRIHDDENTLLDVLEMMAAAGRAVPEYTGEKWTVIIDQPREDVIAHISTRNSWNFSGERVYTRFPDAFRVSFIDETDDYAKSERTVRRPGYSGSLDVVPTISMPGVTDPEQVYREALRRHYEAVLRPDAWVVEQDVEGNVVSRGDLVRLNHDVLSAVHVSGRVIAVDEGSQTVTLDETVTMETGGSYSVRFRTLDGTTPFLSLQRGVTADAGEQTEIVLSGSGDLPNVGDLFQFGEASAETFECIVKAIDYNDNLTCRLTLVPHAPTLEELADDAEVPEWEGGSAGGGGDPVVVPPSATVPAAPDITITSGREVGAVGDVLIALAPGSGNTVSLASYAVEHRLDGAGGWTGPVTVTAAEASLLLSGTYSTGDDIEVRARALGINGVYSAYSTTAEHTVGENDPAYNASDENTRTFLIIEDAEAADDIADTVMVCVVHGYDEVGDTQDSMLFERVDVEPTHEGKFYNAASDSWWSLKNIIRNSAMFGGDAQAAADASAGKKLIVADGEAVAVESISIASTLEDISGWEIAGDVAISVGEGELSTGVIDWQHPYSDRILIAGAAPLHRTLTSVESVTGSAGAWDVVANLDSGDDVTVDDYVLVTGTRPGARAPGLASGRPLFGELQMGFFTIGRASTYDLTRLQLTGLSNVKVNLTTTNASASATVASATGLSVGMLVRQTNVPAGTTVSVIAGTAVTLSSNATGTGTAEAVFGENIAYVMPAGDVFVLRGHIRKVNTITQVLTTVSTTSGSAVVSVADATDIVAGMFVAATGIRAGSKVASIAGTDITLTLAASATSASPVGASFNLIEFSSLPDDVDPPDAEEIDEDTEVSTGLQYWYHARAATGTVTVSGTTATVASGDIGNEANIGDIVLFVGYGPRRITAVSAPTLTLDKSITISVGTQFAIVTAGMTHDGCWPVTEVNVDGNSNRIKWRNTQKTAQNQPPVRNVNTADIVVLKSRIKPSSAVTAFRVAQGATLRLDDIALVGNGGTSSVGIDLRGSDGKSSGHAILSDTVGINGFGYLVRAIGASELHASDVCFSNALTRGIDLNDGAQAYLGLSTISGCTGIGILAGIDVGLRGSDLRLVGNSAQGLRMEVGANIWFDFGWAVGNGGANILTVGGQLDHFVGVSSWKSSNNGLTAQNGIYGRGTGMSMLCNALTGMAVAEGVFEVQQCWAAGNVSGVIAQRLRLTISDSGISWNTTYNTRGLAMAQIVADRVTMRGAGTYGLRVESKSQVYGSSCVFGLATSYDCYAIGGSEVHLVSPTSLSATNISANQVQGDGSVIWDGTGVLFLNGIQKQGANIASASSIDLAAATGDFIDITGTTTIAALGTIAAGVERTLRLGSALTFTHNGASLILPGNANLVCAAGDVVRFRSLGSGNWVLVGYLPKAGFFPTDAAAAWAALGVAPDANLAGTYTQLRLKYDSDNPPLYAEANAIAVNDLCQFRNSGNPATGAIVFRAPTTSQIVMMQMHVVGRKHNANGIMDFIVNGYINSTWFVESVAHFGSVRPTVRWGLDSSSRVVLVIGDVGSTWEFPHVIIAKALLSHTNAADAYTTGWTSSLVTDLSTYTLQSDLTASDKSHAAAAPYTGLTGIPAAIDAIDGLTPAADKIAYYTSASAAALTDLSSFARTLLDDTTQGAMRTTLGLVPGTDVQAYDADLGAVAGLSFTGIVARTGSGTASVRTVTGTDAEITVANGDGVSGNPTLSLPAALTFTGKTVTDGLFTAALRGMVLPETRLILNAFTVEPRKARTTLIDDTVTSLIDAGVWAEIDALWVLAAHNSQAALINWRNPGTNTATAVNSPTFTTDRGYAGDGATSYLDSNYRFGTHSVQLSRDDASYGLWSRTSGQSNTYGIGGVSGNQLIRARVRSTADVVGFSINDATVSTVANTDGSGFFCFTRPDSATKRAYRNGAQLGTDFSVASSGFPNNNNMWLCGQHNSQFSARENAMAFFGGSLTHTQVSDFYTIMQTYMTAVGA